MKNIKVMVSPHFSEEEFVDSVSGIVFKKDPRGGLRVYGISISEERLTGIHDALRRNILIPADNETRDYVNKGNLIVNAKASIKEEVKAEPAKEEQPVVEEAPKARVASEPTKKSSRKRNTKKQAAPKVEKQAEESAE